MLVQRLGQLGSPSCWEATLSKANIILLESKAHKDLLTFCWACLLQMLPPFTMSPWDQTPVLESSGDKLHPNHSILLDPLGAHV